MAGLIPDIIRAKAFPDYKLSVEFEDGVQGVIDLSKWVGKGIFSFWNNENNFRVFTITQDRKIAWSDDIEMDPDAFYLKLVNKSFEEYAGNKQLLRDNH